uniref:Putative uncharacterized protein YNL017C n=1 Tax=Saccharomyces cerevisiae (strain ATCC 204508 / S288c) TaxID=559292 RepID=YNB7_YEAST|nr:RecName: Full=Putative uncharacterized protein YNL017C [Saccharomyces cerevisiae S288C]CAA95879.1 unnamed protein product [Saccharomyces cerevisiae]
MLTSLFVHLPCNGSGKGKQNKSHCEKCKKRMVSSGIEPLIPALLARCLNQLGQETIVICFSPSLHTIKPTSQMCARTTAHYLCATKINLHCHSNFRQTPTEKCSYYFLSRAH